VSREDNTWPHLLPPDTSGILAATARHQICSPVVDDTVDATIAAMNTAAAADALQQMSMPQICCHTDAARIDSAAALPKLRLKRCQLIHFILVLLIVWYDVLYWFNHA
jgi:hypothetical protein